MAKKLTAAEIKRIRRKHASIQHLGTPEKGYTDAGLWRLLPYIYTKDSHDTDRPRKRLLEDGAVYIVVVLLYMLACPKLLIAKSRQIRMSWIAVFYALWHSMTRTDRLVTFQSKKADDAEDMITKGSKDPGKGRLDFMLQHLPRWLADPYVLSGTGNSVGKIAFSPDPVDPSTGVPIPWQGSQIEAMPEGAHQIRGKTPSLALFDEAAFHEGFEEAVGTIMPAVTGGGQFIGFSSVEAGSDFNAMVLEGSGASGHTHTVHPTVQRALDLLGIEWPKGMKSWETPSGVWVLEVHYTADPKKDPARDGAEWFKEAVAGYRGGVDSPRWKTEMEIDYEAGGGDPVFPFAGAGSPIYAPAYVPSDILGSHRFVAGYDYGTRNPSAFEVAAIDVKGKPKFVWEVYEPCTNVAHHSEKIKRCPYWREIEVTYCDPSIAAMNQHTASGLRSMVEIFSDHGVILTPGRRGQDVPIAVRILTDYWADPNEPGLVITKACPNLWKEVCDLRWDRHISAGVAQRKNNPEKIRQKNNHAFDAMVLLIDGGVHAFTPAAPAAPGPGTFGGAVSEMRRRIEASRTRSGGISVV